MRGLLRISTGKAIQWRDSGHSVNRRTLKTKKAAVLILFPKISSDRGRVCHTARKLSWRFCFAVPFPPSPFGFWRVKLCSAQFRELLARFGIPATCYRTEKVQIPKSAGESAGKSAGKKGTAGGTAWGTAGSSAGRPVSLEKQRNGNAPSCPPSSPLFLGTNTPLSVACPKKFWELMLCTSLPHCDKEQKAVQDHCTWHDLETILLV